MQKLLLHICCGPCATPIIPNLNSKFEVKGFYFNPNIYPEAEFEKRLDSAKKVASINDIKLIVPNPSLVIPSPPSERINFAEGSLSNEGKGFLHVRSDGHRRVGRNDNNYESYIDFIKETKNKPERCLLCYKQRLAKTAQHAKENGFEHFSTTLLISPFQCHEDLKRIGEEVGKEFGVSFYYQDFRPLYKESREISKDLDLYLQKYCGCKFSRKRR